MAYGPDGRPLPPGYQDVIQPHMAQPVTSQAVMQPGPGAMMAQPQNVMGGQPGVMSSQPGVMGGQPGIIGGQQSVIAGQPLGSTVMTQPQGVAMMQPQNAMTQALNGMTQPQSMMTQALGSTQGGYFGGQPQAMLGQQGVAGAGGLMGQPEGIMGQPAQSIAGHSHASSGSQGQDAYQPGKSYFM